MEKELSKDLKLGMKFEDGKVKLSLNYEDAHVDASMSVGVKVDEFLKQIEDMIPGKVDDMIIEGLKAAFLNQPTGV